MSGGDITLSRLQVRLIVDTLTTLNAEVPWGCCPEHDKDKAVARGLIDGLSGVLADSSSVQIGGAAGGALSHG